MAKRKQQIVARMETGIEQNGFLDFMEARSRRLEDRLLDMEAQRDHWRVRAEQLLVDNRKLRGLQCVSDS